MQRCQGPLPQQDAKTEEDGVQTERESCSAMLETRMERSNAEIPEPFKLRMSLFISLFSFSEAGGGMHGVCVWGIVGRQPSAGRRRAWPPRVRHPSVQARTTVRYAFAAPLRVR